MISRIMRGINPTPDAGPMADAAAAAWAPGTAASAPAGDDFIVRVIAYGPAGMRSGPWHFSEGRDEVRLRAGIVPGPAGVSVRRFLSCWARMKWVDLSDCKFNLLPCGGEACPHCLQQLDPYSEKLLADAGFSDGCIVRVEPSRALRLRGPQTPPKERWRHQ